MTYSESLAPIGAQADAEVADLRGALGQWQTSYEALARQNAELQQANDTLQEQLDQCRNPVTQKPTAWGSSTGRHSYAFFTQMAGSPLEARRSYQTLGQNPPLEDFGRCASVASVAANPALPWDQVKAALLVYCAKVPITHDMRFIKSHEPENPEKRYDPAVYVAEQRRIRTEVIDPINADRVAQGGTPITFGGNWMAWSLQSAAGRDMTKWWPGDGVWDFLAADGYSGRNPNTQKWEGGRTVPNVFDKFVAFCGERDVRFAVAETGIDVLAPVPDRIRWIDECQQYTKDTDPEFWCYWDGSFSTFWLNTADEFRAVVQHP